jgi:hypothetical protein
MNSHLNIEIKENGPSHLIILKGQIDEDSDFSELLKLKNSEIKFDLRQVTMINSCGIREWINYIDKILGKTKISYLQCPQVIIDQINMVKGFVPSGAAIESFFAPYFCEECDKEQSVLLNVAEMKGFSAPKQKCAKCSNDMEFDAIEQQYFHFLKQK